MSAVSTRAPRASSPSSCSRRVAYQLSASTTCSPASRASSASFAPMYPAPRTSRGSDALDVVSVRDDVPRVDDQPRLDPERLLEELAVLRQEDDAVRLGHALRRPVDTGMQHAVELELRHPRIAVGDVPAARDQLAHDLEARRLARVVDVRLVGDSEEQDLRILDRPADVVE